MILVFLTPVASCTFQNSTFFVVHGVDLVRSTELAPAESRYTQDTAAWTHLDMPTKTRHLLQLAHTRTKNRDVGEVPEALPAAAVS